MIFLSRQVFFANHLQHLRRAERIDVHILRDLRHVPAVGRLVKHDIDVVERAGHRLAIAQVAFDKFGLAANPSRLAAPVCLRLEIVEDAHANLRARVSPPHVTDQAGAAGNERLLFFIC